jgi:hypothetical protein
MCDSVMFSKVQWGIALLDIANDIGPVSIFHLLNSHYIFIY